MLRHKGIDRICCLALVLTLLLTVGYMGAAAGGLIEANAEMGYENRLFDSSRVHTLEIVMDDWEGFLETCANEEYASCALVIDGESYKNVAIRAKGNTSLSSVASYGNNRYSFKIEFDHYQAGHTYHGLDKLSLNNLIQDTTRMKDYLAYTLMGKMGAAAPLCSYVQIHVNGEPWGLYLAVEGVEDSFLQRNYGKDHGELYKPDSLSFGGGRGNGRDFDFSAVEDMFRQNEGANQTGDRGGAQASQEFDPFQMMGGMQPGQGMEFPGGMEMPAMPGGMAMPEGNLDFSNIPDMGNLEMPGGMNFGGMGSNDVKLIYSDDDPASYSNIFNNAKTEITGADQARLIASLKALNEGSTAVVDTEAVIRYLAVHDFLCNGDSYTGTMVHNYYLYEEDGVLSLIPWDYNLAFGSFSMGGMGGGATSTVNSPIDTPVSSGSLDDRPMVAWIFENEAYTAQYHAVYQELVEKAYDSGWLAEEISRVSQMIDSYVQNDPTSFFTYQEFQAGVENIQLFCQKRFESVKGQLAGEIPSTSAAQRNASTLIDASDVNLSALGSMGGKGDRGGFGNGFSRPERTGNQAAAPDRIKQSPEPTQTPAPTATPAPENQSMFQMPGMPSMEGSFPQGMPGVPGGQMTPPDMGGQNIPQMPGMPSDGQFPQGMPENFQMPEGMDPSQFFGGMMQPLQNTAAPTTAPTEAPLEAAETPDQEAKNESFRGWQRMGGGSGMSFPGAAAGAGSMDSGSHWMLLAASAAVLALGIVIAGLFKGKQ